MKSGVIQVNSGSSHERKEIYKPRRRSSSPEDRYMERGRSRTPEGKRSLDHNKSDREHYSEKGHYRDKNTESRGREREKQERERESDWRRHRRSPSPDRRNTVEPSTLHDEPPPKKKKEDLDPILTRTGAYQRMSWEALKKSINGLVNKVNVSNIENIIHELLQENIVRGRGLLSRSILQAQGASPIFTHVYAAVVAIINSKFPNIGELILKRLILNFRKGYRRNDKQLCLAASKFVAHLMNQNVAHEVLCLEMLTLLLERPTDDSIEVAIGFLKECGLKLTEVSPRGINAIFDRLRHVLHESETDKRVQYMIEVMFAVRKDGFKDHPIILDGLDLVEEEDQFTHMLPLEDDYNPEDVLNVFKLDPDFMENEEKYKALKKEILDEGDSDSETGQDAGSSEEEEEEGEEEEEENEEGQKVTIHDKTEINLVSFRRTIYLAIQSSLDFEECAHKLLKMDFPESQTKELCNMILDCCAQQRTYEKFFGLLAGVLECITLSEETTTSSSRIFVKIFFQELSEYMGLPNLNARLKDEDELREHLKNAPKIIMTQKQDVESSDSSSESESSGSDDATSSSGSSGSSSGSESSSDSEHSTDSEMKRRKPQKKKTLDKDTKRKQVSKKKELEKKERRRQPERENGAERDSERNADRKSKDPGRRDEASKKSSYDRDYSSDRNNYWSGKDRDQERNMSLESKTSHSKKKRAERRNSLSDNEGKDRHWTKEGELHRRRKDRSKSKERPRNYPSPREDEERSRYSDQFKESRRDEGRRRPREDSPYVRRGR
ncbi:hypothetical protein lerEdw1_004241 [Lerista edwardsae]|nr:hypothetical protein lerEdw1_004241 [Lerista edwardsae]